MAIVPQPLVRAITALFALLVVGCYAPPVVAPVNTGSTSLGFASDSGLWPDDEDDQRDLPAGTRVVIMECSVEFVTMKQEGASKRQAMVGGPLGPIAAIVDLSGAMRRRVDYPSDVLLDLPRQIYDEIVDDLESRRLIVVDPGVVVASRSYQHMGRSAVKRSSPAYHLDPVGCDAGRPTQFVVYPAWPLRVLADPIRGDDATVAERAILAELDADVAMRLRIRIGVYQGRASVERGSVISIAGVDGTRRIVSVRSLVSSALVAAALDFEVVAGRRYYVEWPAFRREALDLAPGYVAGGLFDAPRWKRSAPVRSAHSEQALTP